MTGHRQTGPITLQNRLVLHRFICREFGHGDVCEMLNWLRKGMGGEVRCRIMLRLS